MRTGVLAPRGSLAPPPSVAAARTLQDIVSSWLVDGPLLTAPPLSASDDSASGADTRQLSPAPPFTSIRLFFTGTAPRFTDTSPLLSSKHMVEVAPRLRMPTGKLIAALVANQAWGALDDAIAPLSTLLPALEASASPLDAPGTLLSRAKVEALRGVGRPGLALREAVAALRAAARSARAQLSRRAHASAEDSGSSLNRQRWCCDDLAAAASLLGLLRLTAQLHMETGSAYDRGTALLECCVAATAAAGFNAPADAGSSAAAAASSLARLSALCSSSDDAAAASTAPASGSGHAAAIAALEALVQSAAAAAGEHNLATFACTVSSGRPPSAAAPGGAASAGDGLSIREAWTLLALSSVAAFVALSHAYAGAGAAALAAEPLEQARAWLGIAAPSAGAASTAATAAGDGEGSDAGGRLSAVLGARLPAHQQPLNRSSVAALLCYHASRAAAAAGRSQGAVALLNEMRGGWRDASTAASSAAAAGAAGGSDSASLAPHPAWSAGAAAAMSLASGSAPVLPPEASASGSAATDATAAAAAGALSLCHLAAGVTVLASGDATAAASPAPASRCLEAAAAAAVEAAAPITAAEDAAAIAIASGSDGGADSPAAAMALLPSFTDAVLLPETDALAAAGCLAAAAAMREGVAAQAAAASLASALVPGAPPPTAPTSSSPFTSPSQAALSLAVPLLEALVRGAPRRYLRPDTAAALAGLYDAALDGAAATRSKRVLHGVAQAYGLTHLPTTAFRLTG